MRTLPGTEGFRAPAGETYTFPTCTGPVVLGASIRAPPATRGGGGARTRSRTHPESGLRIEGAFLIERQPEDGPPWVNRDALNSQRRTAWRRRE